MTTPPEPQPAPRVRLNPRAAGWCAGLAAVFAVVHLVLVSPDGDDAGRVLGEGFGKAAVPALVVWLVARSSRRRWPWWKYVVAVLVPTLLLAALTGLQDRVRDRKESAALADEPRTVIVAPPVVLDLEQTPIPEDKKAAMTKAFRDVGADVDSDLVVGLYSKRSGQPELLLYGVNPEPGSDMDRDSREDSAEVLDEFVGGARIKARVPAEAGPAGGSMTCGRIEPTPGQVLPVCAWAAPGRVGMLMFLTGPSLEDAADRTRSARQQVELFQDS